MKQYHDLIKRVLMTGDVQFKDRTETYVLGISSAESVYDMRKGFPLLTTKNVPPRLPFEEGSWKLRGEHTVRGLFDRDIHIWDANAFDYHLKQKGLKDRFPKHTPKWDAEFRGFTERLASGEIDGELGPVYGYQWRHWGKIRKVLGHAAGTEWVPESLVVEERDQLKSLLRNIRERPGDAYHILSAWNVGELEDMALAPCPFWHQFTVWGDNLDLTMGQRSCDLYLGVPFNVAQDARLLHMVAKETGLNPRKFYHNTFNTHIYLGVGERGEFLADEKNLSELRRRLSEVKDRSEYMAVREWYLGEVPAERKGAQRKDHIPFVLEQLSYEPQALPTLEVADVPLLEAIERPALEVTNVIGYTPHKWDSKAAMAA